LLKYFRFEQAKKKMGKNSSLKIKEGRSWEDFVGFFLAKLKKKRTKSDFFSEAKKIRLRPPNVVPSFWLARLNKV
jgi:hypothetical protein